MDDVNFLEECRRCVVIQHARYQQSLQRYHERRIRRGTLQVLCRAQSREGKDKLSPMWDGPFLVTHMA